VKGSGAGAVVRDIHKLFGAAAGDGLTDGQLLDRFVTRGDGASLEVLVRRHGPMVWGVCRRVLRDHHDAEDAFQATFLVLARRAASVLPREKVGNWLYGVAHQTALRARATRARRQTREAHIPNAPEPEAVPHPGRDDLAEVLDHELSRLPEKFRTPIVLCELEGKTHGQAAEQLGWPVGTVSGRLSRAKALLAERLSRRGVSVAGAALAVLLARSRGSAATMVPTPLLSSTAKAASLFAAKQVGAGGPVSSTAETLTREVLGAMRFSRLKLTTVALLMLTVAGAALWQARTWADEAAPLGDSGAAVDKPLAGPLPDGTFRVTVSEVIREEGTVVTQIGIETLPGSKIELLPDQENRNMSSISVTTGPNDPARLQMVVLGDHVQGQWKGGSVNAVKFALSYQVGKISSSTSETVPMPDGAKELADVLTVPIKSGEYKYGQPTKLLTFKGVTYRLVVTRPE